MTPRKASPEVTSNTRSDARSRATAAARKITIAATVLSTTLIPIGVATAAQAHAAPAAITAHAATRSGWHTAHSSARAPPIEPPTTSRHRRIPSRSASRASAATVSRTVMRGKREPHGAASGV